MLEIIRNKLIDTINESEKEMMGNSEEALVATGRYVACRLLLKGHSINDVRDGLIILPPHWPQRQGAEGIVKQFKGLI